MFEIIFRIFNITYHEETVLSVNWRESLLVTTHPFYADYPSDKKRPKLFRYAPNSFWYTQYPDNENGYFDENFQIHYQMNSSGYRDSEFGPKSETTARIISIGDSFTFGEGVKSEHVFPGVLESKLFKSGCKSEVYNLGINGHDLKDEYALLPLHLNIYQPDLVIWQFLFNDISNYYLYHEWQEMMAEKKVDFMISVPSFFLYYIQERIWKIIKSKAYYQSLLDVYNDPEYWMDLENNLHKVHELVKQSGAEMFIVLFPTLDMIDENTNRIELIHKKLGDLFTREDIPFLDITSSFQENNPESLWVHRIDGHPNETAHSIAAEEIFKYLEANSDKFSIMKNCE